MAKKDESNQIKSKENIEMKGEESENNNKNGQQQDGDEPGKFDDFLVQWPR